MSYLRNNLFGLVTIALWPFIIIFHDLQFLIEKNFFIMVTMIIGSFIAGASSEGGGAVAFPVMTLIYGISPSTARDFSLLIQGVGMTAASLTIIRSQIPIHKKAIVLASLGALLGNILGFQYINQLVSPAATKLFFCTVWVSFSFILFWTKFIKKEKSSNQISVTHSNGLILVLGGIIGGIITAMTGVGVDMVTFALLTLYFNTSETIATPTSVIIMAVNSVICISLKHFFFDPVDLQAFEYFLTCIPVVVIGAPLGAIFIKKSSGLKLVIFLLAATIIQFIAALIIIPLNRERLLLVLITIFTSTALFLLLRSRHNKAIDLMRSSPIKGFELTSN